MTWIYKYEAKGIQKWIMATDKLVELRGGSEIVDQLASAAEKLTHVKPIYAAAGGGEYHFASKQELEDFASEWPMKVSYIAPGLEIVQAWGKTPEELLERLGEARNRPFIELPEAGPWTARAPRSGLPAKSRQNGLLEDAATEIRQARGKRDEALGPERVLGQIWTKDLHNHRIWGEGPIAVIHADGNGIGQQVIELRKSDPSGEKIAGFARALDEATKEAARTAVDWLKEVIGKDEDLPARPIVIGGDDFTFIVRGEYAIEFLIQWLKAFEDETSKRDAIPDKLTACGGVVFVNSRFPFATAHEIAEACCKGAKERLRGKDKSGFVFERVTASQSDDLTRSNVYNVGTETDSALDWGLALEGLANLEKLPRGKLRQWIALEDSERTLLWNRIEEVAQKSEYAVPWKRFAELVKTQNRDEQVGFVADLLALRQIGQKGAE